MKIKGRKIKIFVTGATGFLGSHLIRELKRRKLDFKCLVGDIRNNNLKTALSGVNVVIHLAGVITSSSKNLYYDVNVRGTKNLIKACKENKIKRFIHISTQDVIFEKGSYSISKLQGEEAVKGSKLDFTIFRPTMIYGKGNCDFKKLINLIKRLPITLVVGSGKNEFQPVYVKDIVKAIIKAIETDKTIGKTYPLGGAERISFNDLIDLILKKLQLKKTKIHLPLIFALTDKIRLLTYDKICDNSLAEKDLNFKPIGIKSGIEFLIV